MMWSAAALSMLVSPLILAGYAHLADVNGFAQTIRSHGLFTGAGAGLLARTVTALELGGPVLLLAALVLGPRWARPAAAALAVLLAIFACYLVLVQRRTEPGQEIDCGCGLGTRLHRWSWLRPAGLGVGFLLVLALGERAPGVDERALAVATGWSLTTAALSLWHLRRMNARAMAGARHAYRLIVRG